MGRHISRRSDLARHLNSIGKTGLGTPPESCDVKAKLHCVQLHPTKVILQQWQSTDLLWRHQRLPNSGCQNQSIDTLMHEPVHQLLGQELSAKLIFNTSNLNGICWTHSSISRIDHWWPLYLFTIESIPISILFSWKFSLVAGLLLRLARMSSINFRIGQTWRSGRSTRPRGMPKHEGCR